MIPLVSGVTCGVQFLDVSNNDLKYIADARCCSQLNELNAYSNEIKDPDTVLALKELRCLQRLNVGWNDLDDSRLGDSYASKLQTMFQQAGSPARIVTNPDFSGGDAQCHYKGAMSRYNWEGQQQDGAKSGAGGCCTVL